jgi:hypothetical protein
MQLSRWGGKKTGANGRWGPVIVRPCLIEHNQIVPGRPGMAACGCLHSTRPLLDNFVISG